MSATYLDTSKFAKVDNAQEGGAPSAEWVSPEGQHQPTDTAHQQGLVSDSPLIQHVSFNAVFTRCVCSELLQTEPW